MSFSKIFSLEMLLVGKPMGKPKFGCPYCSARTLSRPLGSYTLSTLWENFTRYFEYLLDILLPKSHRIIWMITVPIINKKNIKMLLMSPFCQHHLMKLCSWHPRNSSGSPLNEETKLKSFVSSFNSKQI